MRVDQLKMVRGKSKRIYLSWSDDKTEWIVTTMSSSPDGVPHHWSVAFEEHQYAEATGYFYSECEKHAEDILAGALGL